MKPHVVIVDWRDGRITKWKDFSTNAEAASFRTSVLDDYPDAFIATGISGEVSDWLVNNQSVTRSPDLGAAKAEALQELRQIFNDQVEAYQSTLTGVSEAWPGSTAQMAAIAYHMALNATVQARTLSIAQVAISKRNSIQGAASWQALRTYLTNNPLNEGWPS